jgi:hypothetical protein
MNGRHLQDLIRLEGRHVGLVLSDGSRIDDCQLVFAGRERVWVYANGRDSFVAAPTVIDFWESAQAKGSANGSAGTAVCASRAPSSSSYPA